MVSMALLGTQIAQQLEASPEGLQGVELVWNGESLSELARVGPQRRPQVVVAELDLLGSEPANALKGLRKSVGPEMTLVIYSYAKRDVVGSLHAESTRLLQGPVSLSALRSQMLGLIVRSMLSDGSERRVPCPRCGTQVAPRQLSAS